ncbi:MAG TPA: DEAD/DEAH box helicase [Bacteroidales bacterium]|nr:DEAD/DEAH box helicase [Bacteroidales bacterium]HPS63837.1 DEAD/DEAH box helicase [Bacteroidales bacterium]
MNFENLNLIQPILEAVSKKGYLNPTPIQEKAIPVILQGKDIFGCAQTGTGKTAAFALPILQMLATSRDRNRSRATLALVLAPTRELVAQIGEEISSYSKGLDCRVATIYGGVSQHSQTQTLRKGAEIIVAAPGRLLDLINQGFIDLSKIEYLVLDEADRMLDMGFIHDIRRITVLLPEKRQTMLFSATAPDEIRKLAATLLHNPVRVDTTPDVMPPSLVSQSVYLVTKENKKHLLTYVLQNELVRNVLVFTRTKHGADKVVKELVRHGITAKAIHGNKSQSARDSALCAFKNRSIRVLVATDVASRGIDVDKLSHVINYEIPEQPETYVHRIGRTGRAGESGIALSFCSSEEAPYLKSIHKLIHRNIEVVTGHPFAIN